jgi:hypothetical protein
MAGQYRLSGSILPLFSVSIEGKMKKKYILSEVSIKIEKKVE